MVFVDFIYTDEEDLDDYSDDVSLDDDDKIDNTFA